MLASFAKAGLALMLGAVGFVALGEPTETCRLKIENTGTAGDPVYKPLCEGECAGNAGCNLRSIITQTSSSWYCECGTNVPDALCDATLIKTDTFSIVCVEVHCVNDCLESGLPAPGTTVNACVCPDA